MKLMMYIGNDLIETVPLEQEKVRVPGYVGNFKRILKRKYDELIRQSVQQPEFLISDILPKLMPKLKS